MLYYPGSDREIGSGSWKKYCPPLVGVAQSVLRLTPILVVFVMFGISPPALAQSDVDLSNLDDQTQKQVKAACCFYKCEGGPAYS